MRTRRSALRAQVVDTAGENDTMDDMHMRAVERSLGSLLDEQRETNRLLTQILDRLTEPVLRDTNYFEKG